MATAAGGGRTGKKEAPSTPGDRSHHASERSVFAESGARLELTLGRLRAEKAVRLLVRVHGRSDAGLVSAYIITSTV
jgi:hypothetical protein